MNTDFKELDNLNIEDELDFDYSVGEIRIESMADFERELMEPYNDPTRKLYYRGERINLLSRPLLPTMFRSKNRLIENQGIDPYHLEINADYLLDYYKSYRGYFDLFNAVFGKAGEYRLYDLCAFSQHYLNNSPFIDFTKSIHVALSFGLKEKTEFSEDGVLYTVEIDDPRNYTNDKVVAECWLRDYKVTAYNFENAPDTPEMRELKAKAQRTSPSAKLIDIATNDLMKFQQGVFLLLTDFSLVNRLYLTKNVRHSFKMKKYLIAPNVCAELVRKIAEEKPWYKFSNLLEISNGLNSAIEHGKTKF